MKKDGDVAHYDHHPFSELKDDHKHDSNDHGQHKKGEHVEQHGGKVTHGDGGKGFHGHPVQGKHHHTGNLPFDGKHEDETGGYPQGEHHVKGKK